MKVDMNIAVALKSEITRIARKELRGESLALKKASSQYRSDIAALKRRVLELERLLSRMSKGVSQKANPSEVEGGESGLRFRADGFATLRRRFGFSANEMGALLGVSGQSVYKWEQGKARPRASQLPAIAVARKLSKKEALAKLETLA